MLRKMVLLIVAASFLFIVAVPNHDYNQHHIIQLNDTIGGA
ncbi:competence protein ComGC [Paenibacillus sp. 1182]|nr:competence protein ComGC [Paenibacillus sp. 1182]